MSTTSTEAPTLLTCPGVVDGWIEVDGKKVPHYSIEYDSVKSETTCWIESEAGKSFAIGISQNTLNFSTTWAVYLDGTKVKYLFTAQNAKHAPFLFKSMRISNTECRLLAFGSLELTDDDTYLNQMPQGIGEIKIVISKMTSYQKVPTVEQTPGDYSIPETQKIHEREKKGLAHCIKQGEIVHEPKTRSTISWIPHGLTHLTTFVFRYRPRAMLQANGIIPPDSTPTPTPPTLAPESGPSQRVSPSVKRELSAEAESGDDDPPTEEEKALLARLQAIKREKLAARESGGSAPRKKIKLERNNDQPKFYFTPGEVIDLTLDSPKKEKKDIRRQRTVGRSADVLDLT